MFGLCACAHEAHGPAHGAWAGQRELSPEASSPPIVAPSATGEGDAALGTRFSQAPAIARIEGQASYYSDRLAGHKTASGERYQPQALTAAHRNLPLGTVLRVSRRDGQRTVYVRINDRGPFGNRRRILDLSRAAFERLASTRAGVLEVRAEVVSYGIKRGR